MRASNERIERGLKSGCWPGDWTTCTSVVRFAFPPASASHSQTRLSVSFFSTFGTRRPKVKRSQPASNQPKPTPQTPGKHRKRTFTMRQEAWQMPQASPVSSPKTADEVPLWKLWADTCSVQAKGSLPGSCPIAALSDQTVRGTLSSMICLKCSRRMLPIRSSLLPGQPSYPKRCSRHAR